MFWWSQLSHTGESSDTDFGDHEHDAVLFDAEDDNLSDTNFLWEATDNYVQHQETVIGISGP